MSLQTVIEKITDWAKTYSRINWENKPSTNTALGATNLNKMDLALNEIDNRVVTLGQQKLDKDTANNMVSSWSMDENTGVITVTLLDGTTTSYDLNIEKIPASLELTSDGMLKMTTDDGEVYTADLSSLIREYTFQDSSTITFTVSSGTNSYKEVTATVKAGSITDNELNSTLINNLQQQVSSATQSAADADNYAKLSKRYAVGGVIEGDDTDNAKYYYERTKEESSKVDIDIATKTRAGIVKASDDIAVAEDGAMRLSDAIKTEMEDTASALSAHAADKENPHETAGSQLTGPVPVSLGGTGATTVAEALNNLGASPFGFAQKKEVYSSGNFIDCINDLYNKGIISLTQPTSLVSFYAINDVTGLPNSKYGWYSFLIYGIGNERTVLASPSWRGDKQFWCSIYIPNGTNEYEMGIYGWKEFATVDKTIPLIDGAGPHNATYRGKALGSAVTDEQWAAIAAGTFTDLYIGDYWTIGGVNYRIAAFDYYLRSGDTDMTTHYVTLVPDTNLYNHVMNDTNTTEGAYIGSKMYTEGLARAKTTINNAFGAAHILTHRRHMQNAVTNGYSTGGTWYDSNVELMTEQNVYGGRIFGNAINGTGWPNLYTNDKSQYPLFAMRPDMISNRQIYWLRDVASASHFCHVNGTGYANASAASYSYGVRPAFSIKS